MKLANKRGQMTLFVIVAIVIVALIVLLFLFKGEVNRFLGIEEAFSPNSYLTSCVEPEIKPAVELLASQGGYRNPDGAIEYDGKKIKYLCYTKDNYVTCAIQQPMIKKHFEDELNEMVKDKASKCIQNLIKEYEKRGYSVNSGASVSSEINIIPQKIHVAFNAPLSVQKEETTQKFKGFEAEIKSEMYDLLFIASSIVEYEAILGDSATELYMNYYPNLKIEKIKLSDSSTIYKLSDVVTKDEFTFASRSLAWPAGYGLEG